MAYTRMPTATFEHTAGKAAAAAFEPTAGKAAAAAFEPTTGKAAAAAFAAWGRSPAITRSRSSPMEQCSSTRCTDRTAGSRRRSARVRWRRVQAPIPPTQHMPRVAGRRLGSASNQAYCVQPAVSQKDSPLATGTRQGGQAGKQAGRPGAPVPGGSQRCAWTATAPCSQSSAAAATVPHKASGAQQQHTRAVTIVDRPQL